MRRTSGCGSLLLSALAVLLAGTYVVLLPAAIIAHDIGRVVFSSSLVGEVITNRLVEGGAFRRLFVPAIFSGEAQDSELGRAIAGLNARDQDEAVRILVPEGWARDQVTRIVSGLYAWIDNSRPAPDLSLDLRPLRENLLTGAASDLVELVVDSWPACTLEQLEEMSQAALAIGETPILYCEPSEPFRGLLVGFAGAMITDQARQMQTVVPLGQDFVQDLGGGDVMAFKEQLRMLRVVAKGGWMVAVALLGLIMACVVRSWRGLGRWWGIPTLAAGVVCLAAGLIGGGLAVSALQTAADSAGANLLASVLPVIVSGVLDQALGRILLHGAMVAAAGAVVLIGGSLLGRRFPEPEVTSAVAAPPAGSAAAPQTAKRGPRPPGEGGSPSGLIG